MLGVDMDPLSPILDLPGPSREPENSIRELLTTFFFFSYQRISQRDVQTFLERHLNFEGNL